MGNAEKVARRIITAGPGKGVRTDAPVPDCPGCGGPLGESADGYCRGCRDREGPAERAPAQSVGRR